LESSGTFRVQRGNLRSFHFGLTMEFSGARAVFLPMVLQFLQVYASVSPLQNYGIMNLQDHGSNDRICLLTHNPAAVLTVVYILRSYTGIEAVHW
jgi:hypothetical protein